MEEPTVAKESTLGIITYPNPILVQEAADVEEINQEVIDKIGEMFDLMDKFEGVGLAAPQVGWSTRIFILDPLASADFDQNGPQEKVFINPRIVKKTGKEVGLEACLSIPKFQARVQRATKIKLRATGLDKEEFEIEAEGLLARVIQHEYDHVEGLLFTTKVVPSEVKRAKKHLKRLRLFKELLDEKREAIKAKADELGVTAEDFAEPEPEE